MKRVTVLMFLAACCAGSAFAAALTLVTPNGGESLTSGATFEIRWNAVGCSQKVKLVLIRSGGALVGVIAANLDASPSVFSWTVGQYRDGSADPGSDYKVRIKTMDDSMVDVSDASFTIGEGSATPGISVRTQRGTLTRVATTTVRVTNPNTGAAVNHGDAISITWEYANARPGQKLKVFAKRYTARCHRETGFNQLILLGNLPIETGRFHWEIPPTIRPAYTYSIRLEPTVPGDFVPDESDECFEVRSRTTIRVLEPNGGEVFSRGSTIPIRLQMTHFQPVFMWVQVYLWRFDAACDSAVIGTFCNGFDSDLSACSCLISPDLPAGNYKINLTVFGGDRSRPGQYAIDSSDACFTIR